MGRLLKCSKLYNHGWMLIFSIVFERRTILHRLIMQLFLQKKTDHQATMLQTLIEEITSANELKMHHLVNRCCNSFEKLSTVRNLMFKKNDVQFIRRRTMGIPVFHHQKL